MNHRITCSKCQGKGIIELPQHLKETLEWLERNPHSTAQEVRQGVTPQGTVLAINNRLAVLEELKLVERGAKDVRSFRWFAR